ncbi:MAG TPA: efflux RND transporter periplasmic adaptor subunit [Candidatus Paceibacterota bacterium]
MKNILNIVKKYKKSLIIGLLVLLAVLYFVFTGGGNSTEAYLVKEANIEQSVILSGKIQTTNRADLGFAATGRLAKISVKNDQKVAQGQVLAQLEIGDLLADLKIKELNSKTSDVDLKAAEEELENVTTEENTKVQNAERAMLSADLELVSNSSTYEMDPPIISGAYTGVAGQYRVRIDMVSINDSKPTIRTTGLESTTKMIHKSGATPLGSRGLYISFLGEPDDYEDTVWFLDIPNKAGASYTANLNAYEEANDARDLAIKAAEKEYKKLLTENDGGNSVAQAEVQKIRAEITKNTIYAPFAGKVTNIEKEVGENASTGERVISILGESNLEVVLQVSELDVSKLVPGAEIKISIDALPREEFIGSLTTVNSRETEIDGVPVYEAFVELESDVRIKTGMNAKGIIVLESKANVIAVPLYLIRKVENKNFVDVITANGSTQEREVTIGLTGSDSMVEIISGLNIGEKLVTDTDEK